MFPGGVYEKWEEYLEHDYKRAKELEGKLNYQRATIIKNDG